MCRLQHYKSRLHFSISLTCAAMNAFSFHLLLTLLAQTYRHNPTEPTCSIIKLFFFFPYIKDHISTKSLCIFDSQIKVTLNLAAANKRILKVYLDSF